MRFFLRQGPHPRRANEDPPNEVWSYLLSFGRADFVEKSARKPDGPNCHVDASLENQSHEHALSKNLLTANTLCDYLDLLGTARTRAHLREPSHIFFEIERIDALAHGEGGWRRKAFAETLYSLRHLVVVRKLSG